MCGIVGYLGSPRPIQQGSEELTVRRDRLTHRGPDDQGNWIREDGSVGLGHRRLSILDLSPEGHQPMGSADGRYKLAFNGEIYNFRELRQELAGLGHAFRGSSDTEVMLAAFCQWGIQAALRRFFGMFAFGVWDEQERALTLARDHYGKKPLYYGNLDGTWCFASELKALHRPGLALDRQALANYFRFGYVPDPRSIYQNIHKLPPASSVVLQAGQSAGPVQKFWSIPRNSPLAPPADPLQAVDRVLRRAVERRMVSDVPLGAFLSGGVDSSLIVALMQQISKEPVQTFCIGFEDRKSDESPYARAVAQHLGTRHVEHRLSPEESLAVVPLLPRLYDEPFADSSQIPTYLVSKLARTQVTVALSGDGGDEVFGGYNRYFHAPRLWSGLRLIPRFMRQLLALAARGLSAEFLARLIPRVSLAQHKVTKFLALLAVNSPRELYEGLMAMWVSSPVLGLVPEGGILDGFSWGNDFAADMMTLDTQTYLPDDILVKMDRASMAVSLECRAPFLDPEVAEVAWSLPMEWKVRSGVGKVVLRKLLAQYLPTDLIERPKIGFSLPLGEWLRGPLRGWAEDLLAPDRIKREGLLDANLIRRRWQEHLSGQRNHAAALWCVLMFEAWLAEWT